MRRGLVAGMIAVLMTAAPGVAEDPVAEIDWGTTAPLSGTVENGVVVIESSVPGVFPIAVIDGPALSGGDIVMTVDVAIRDMVEPAYLELWAVYDDGSRFFSRTVDQQGIGVLRDAGSGRVELPFGLSSTVPDSLELNAVLPGGGHIEIGAVVLFEVDGVVALVDGSDGWWSATTAGIVGGVAGAAIGILGAVLGSLASRRAAREFVMATLKLGTAVGVMSAAAGLVALALGQPYEVWFVLLLLGAILGLVLGGLIRSVGTRYEASELHRMRAMDSV